MNSNRNLPPAQNSFLSEPEKAILLEIARDAITSAVYGQAPDQIDPEKYSPILRENGASFVTLSKNGNLRGCIGTIEAYQPFILDVQEHAGAAALEDYRFSPVRKEEIEHISIEISRLTPIRPLNYSTPDDLVSKLHVHVDGVLIKSNGRRATFLPQVWEKVPDAEQFLSQLCMKMGAGPDLWKLHTIQVFTYQVESFEEA